MRCDCRVERGRTGECLIEAGVLVDFVGEEDDGVCCAKGAERVEFLRCEDFAERVVARDH